MKVILLEDVDGLGTKGDMVDVAKGYGRNYLVPRGLAQEATRGNMKSLEQRRQALLRRAEKERAEAEKIAERLAAMTVEVTARAGEKGRLFGSVTTSDIADALLAQGEIEVDRRRIELAESIRAIGTYEVPVKLQSGVTATIKVQVNPEGGAPASEPEGTAEEVTPADEGAADAAADEGEPAADEGERDDT